MKRLALHLNKQHSQLNADILKNYNIDQTELITGVACPCCNRLPMVRVKRSWFCSFCSEKSTHAHVKALQDYALLFSPYVKNKDIREFLHIDSQTAVKKLLYSMDLKPNGSRKSAIYTLPLPK